MNARTKARISALALRLTFAGTLLIGLPGVSISQSGIGSGGDLDGKTSGSTHSSQLISDAPYPALGSTAVSSTPIPSPRIPHEGVVAHSTATTTFTDPLVVNVSLFGAILPVLLSEDLPVIEGPDYCPCLESAPGAADREWATFSTTLPPDGYQGLTQSCDILTPAEDQASVWIIDDVSAYPFTLFWIMTTQYDGIATECAQVIDGPIRPLTTQGQHDACVAWLKTNYIDATTAEDCI